MKKYKCVICKKEIKHPLLRFCSSCSNAGLSRKIKALRKHENGNKKSSTLRRVKKG